MKLRLCQDVLIMGICRRLNKGLGSAVCQCWLKVALLGDGTVPFTISTDSWRGKWSVVGYLGTKILFGPQHRCASLMLACA